MASFFNNYFFIFLAIIAGMMMPTQAAINNKLALSVNSPILAAFISFIVGTVGLFIYILATGIPLGNLAEAKNAPLIAWIGGFVRRVFCRRDRFARAASRRCVDVFARDCADKWSSRCD